MCHERLPLLNRPGRVPTGIREEEFPTIVAY